MASAAQQVPTATCTPDVVGNAFVHQYYLILHKSPELVHRFYQDISKLGRPEGCGATMSNTTTMQAINDKIVALHYGHRSAEITTVDAQESYNGGVLVLVTGYLTGNDNLRRKFTQTFFLAPQDKGYFVLNDMFRFLDEVEIVYHDQISGSVVDQRLTHDVDPTQAQDNKFYEQPPTLEEDEAKEEVYDPSENGDVPEVINASPVPEVVDEAPVREVLDEVPDESHKVADSNTRIEEVQKKSYASILKVMRENTPVSTASPPPRQVTKSQEQQVVAAPSPAQVSETPASLTNATENGSNQDGEVEGPSIYLKGLPFSATIALLENEFKKFGPIRSGGVQVRSQKGFYFGFVEFEEASAVQSAIEASPILIGGRRVVVEEKRSTGRGNNRVRSFSAAGSGYRNEGVRSRGSYGSGRGGYGRGDYNNNRSEYGNRNEYGNRGNNRGGFANRGGGDGYQRADGGGRVNRAGNMNAAAKTVTPRVSATA